MLQIAKHAFIILLFLITSQYNYSQENEDARSYLNFIDKENGKVVEQTWNYMETYTNSDDLLLKKGQRKKLENVLRMSLNRVTKTKPFDARLQTAAIDYLNGNLSIVKNEFLTLLNSRKERTVSVDQIGLIQRIRKAIVKLREDYDNAIRSYGAQNDITIIENDSHLAKQMQHTIALYDYYHKLQIVFSELQKAESILWRDINEKNITSFYSDREEAKKYVLSKEDLTQLSSFNEDLTLLNIIKDMNTHLKETLTQRLEAIEIIKKDQVNGNRENIMTKTKNYNASLKWANQDRKRIYDLWKTTYPAFLRKHINLK